MVEYSFTRARHCSTQQSSPLVLTPSKSHLPISIQILQQTNNYRVHHRSNKGLYLRIIYPSALDSQGFTVKVPFLEKYIS